MKPYDPYAAHWDDITSGRGSERSATAVIEPSNVRSKNELRAEQWDDIIGQAEAKRLVKLMVDNAKAHGRPLDHVLMVGPAGTGKTTFATVIANQLGSQMYQLAAPIDADMLAQLAEVMQDGDVLFVDEIHMQAVQERRGRSSATKPEVLFSILEDFTMPTEYGVVAFPRITFIGATTDEGMLPDPFLDRFPIRPRLTPYSPEDMALIVQRAADKLGIRTTRQAVSLFADASRGVPRQVISYVKNAQMLASDGVLTPELALTVLRDLNGVSDDGLTSDMQELLKFLRTRARRESQTGEVRYQASVSTIATAIGKSRDMKAVQLRIEPYLITRGYLQVLHGGRALTDLGVERAEQLLEAA